MPEVISEFAADQAACALADSRDHANWMLTVATSGSPGGRAS
jgi:hypothetical protein